MARLPDGRSLLALGALAFVACAAERAPPPIAATPPEPAPPMLGAEVFRVPEERCRDPLNDPMPEAPELTDDAAIAVRKKGERFSLETRGASAGRVLVALGRAAGRPVRADGFGRSVRIWAYVPDETWETLVTSVAHSSGLVMVRRENELSFVDPQIAARDRRKAVLESIEFTPIETRLIPAERPLEMARVLAATALGCRGTLVAAPARGLLIAREVAGNLHHMEAILRELERPTPVPEPVAPDLPRARPASPAPPVPREITRCPSIAKVAAPNGAGAAMDGDGVAAGDLVTQLAKARKAAAIVGCGGDRPVFAHLEAGAPIEDIARAAGLASIDPITFADAEMARASAIASARWQSRDEPSELRILEAPRADELAIAIDALFGDRVSAAAYLPTGRLVVRAPASIIEHVEELAVAWRDDPQR